MAGDVQGKKNVVVVKTPGHRIHELQAGALGEGVFRLTRQLPLDGFDHQLFVCLLLHSNKLFFHCFELVLPRYVCCLYCFHRARLFGVGHTLVDRECLADAHVYVGCAHEAVFTAQKPVNQKAAGKCWQYSKFSDAELPSSEKQVLLRVIHACLVVQFFQRQAVTRVGRGTRLDKLNLGAHDLLKPCHLRLVRARRLLLPHNSFRCCRYVDFVFQRLDFQAQQFRTSELQDFDADFFVFLGTHGFVCQCWDEQSKLLDPLFFFIWTRIDQHVIPKQH